MPNLINLADFHTKTCICQKKAVTLQPKVAKKGIYMSQKTFFKIQYINLCIDEFARKYRLAPQVAYNYLKKFDGLAFLNEHYDVEHTLALQDTLGSLQKICARNGGTL